MWVRGNLIGKFLTFRTWHSLVNHRDCERVAVLDRLIQQRERRGLASAAPRERQPHDVKSVVTTCRLASLSSITRAFRPRKSAAPSSRMLPSLPAFETPP